MKDAEMAKRQMVEATGKKGVGFGRYDNWTPRHRLAAEFSEDNGGLVLCGTHLVMTEETIPEDTSINCKKCIKLEEAEARE